MLTANRVHQFFDALNQAAWDSLIRTSELIHEPEDMLRIATKDDAVILELDLPGLRSEEIDVTAEKDRLSISIKSGTNGEQPKYHLRERTQASSHMEFRIPFQIQEDLTEVTYQDGILRITALPPEQDQRKKLTVKAA